MPTDFAADFPHPTPNFYPPSGINFPPRLLVIHSTRSGIPGNDDVQSTINWFASPTSQASAHILIGRDGRTHRFVPDTAFAWHAVELNKLSWGVELEQPTRDDEFTLEQYHALAFYTLFLNYEYMLPLQHYSLDPAAGGYLGHDQTAQGLRDGKTDPGYRFDWPYFFDLLHPPSPSPGFADEDPIADIHNRLDFHDVVNRDHARALRYIQHHLFSLLHDLEKVFGVAE